MEGNACCSCMTTLFCGQLPPHIKAVDKAGDKCVICESDGAFFYMRDDEVTALREHLVKTTLGGKDNE